MRTTTALLLATFTALSSAALGHEIKAKSLQIDHPWIRVTPKGSAVTAGYLTITNKGKATDYLTGASLEGAGGAEIHLTVVEEGIARMRPVPGGVEIGPGQTVSLEPNGLHIMFTGLKTSYEADTYFDGTLTFRSAGTVKVEFFVEAGSGKPHQSPDSGDEHRH
jgi:copper(I)-binding protein